MHYVRATDAPVNCLPSLHVCTATLCALAMRGSRWFGAAQCIACLCAASTLTFKQHYAVDVITGAALGAAAWWLCFRWRGLQLRLSAQWRDSSASTAASSRGSLAVTSGEKRATTSPLRFTRNFSKFHSTSSSAPPSMP